MNAPLAPPKVRRHVFTLDDLPALVERGVLASLKRVALHEGDIVEMGADGDEHIALSMALARQAFRTLDRATHFIGVQTTLRFSKSNAPSPDLYILAGGPPKGDVDPARILLVVEVADTSLRDDLTDAAGRYARAGVAELWVVDAAARRIFVHQDPAAGAYPAPRIVEPGEPIAPRFVPDLVVRLDPPPPAL